MSARWTLDIVCTDMDKAGNATHAPRHLGRIEWTPSADGSGVAIWDQDSTYASMIPEAIGARSRTARTSGAQLHVESHGVVTETRADGGVTFTFPGCERCGRPATALRDDRLSRYADKVRGTPLEGKPLDVSRLAGPF